MKSAYYTGLQTVALALIFMPEPFTIPVGVALLDYVRRAKQRRPVGLRPPANPFHEHYTYRLDMKDKTTITFQMFPTRQGLLPRAYPKIAKLHDNPWTSKTMYASAQRDSKHKPTPSTKTEPAGLLRAPKPKAHTKLQATKYTPSHR